MPVLVATGKIGNMIWNALVDRYTSTGVHRRHDHNESIVLNCLILTFFLI